MGRGFPFVREREPSLRAGKAAPEKRR